MLKAHRILLIALVACTAFMALAQDAPVLTTTEYDIGFDCPAGQALSPDGTTLYVVSEGCFSGQYSVAAYDLADGTPRDLGGGYSAELDALRGSYIDWFYGMVAFTSDGLLSIMSSDVETFELRRLLLDVASGDTPVPSPDGVALNDLLLQYTPFPESSTFNRDHTLAAAVGSTALTVVDLATGETLLSLPVEEETYNALPTFSEDGQTLYVARLDNYDDPDDYTSTVTAYSLPDGIETGSFPSPSFPVWVSPDGRYAATQRGSNDGTVSELFVVDTVTGATSEPFSLYEPSRPLAACANDGRDMSDVNFTVSGRLSLRGVSWLPDSSGVVVTRSYNGESSGGASPCAFNTSRLNIFKISP